MALKTDGSLVPWGDGTVMGWAESQSTLPAGLNGVLAIAAGMGHTVALVNGLVALDMRRSGNGLILTWPTNAVGFTLQSTTNLTPPVSWVDVTNPPALLGGQWTVTNSFSGGAQYFRLRKP